MTTPVDRDSQPDNRLVELECRNGHTGTPALVSSNAGNGSILGAYCSECRIWIKWVPRTQVWLSLLDTQQRVITTPSQPIGELPSLSPQIQDDIAHRISVVAQLCYDQAGAMGFHTDASRTVGERAMLVVTELAELFEAYRHNTYDQPSEHIPEFSAAAEEWADCLIRIFDHALDDVDARTLGRAVAAKIVFNRTRGYRHGGKRV